MSTSRDMAYDVALSFAGADRSVAEALARALQQNNVSVFYDDFERADLLGKNLIDYLSDLYSRRCRYCVLLISAAYAEGDWTRLERQSAQSAALRLSRDFILPLRLDDTDVPGLLSSTAWVDLRKRAIPDVADLLAEKVMGRTFAARVTTSNPKQILVELQSTGWTSLRLPKGRCTTFTTPYWNPWDCRRFAWSVARKFRIECSFRLRLPAWNV